MYNNTFINTVLNIYNVNELKNPDSIESSTL